MLQRHKRVSLFLKKKSRLIYSTSTSSSSSFSPFFGFPRQHTHRS